MLERMSSWVVLGGLACLLGLSGCSSQDATEAYMDWTKIEAATHSGISGEVDVCLAREWYGDEECDTFCPLFDIDCRDPEAACMADTDCRAEQFCDQSVCLSCCPDAPPDTGCIAACCGVCRDDASGYQPCLDDAACDAGEVCDLGECLSCCPDAPPGSACIDACCGQCVEEPTKTCASDADCTAGAEWCIDGLCLPCDNSGTACLIDCILVDPRNGCQPCQCRGSYTACMGDAQCLAGEVCDLRECLSCCPDAPPGSACIDACCGQCVEQPTGVCASDGDCLAGEEWCVDGLCVPCDNSGAYCDLFCPNGMVPARNGCQPCMCLPDYLPCMGDAQCGPDEVCDLGECLSCCPDAPPGSPCIDLCCGQCVEQPTEVCASDADCLAGEEWCVDGLCVPCDNSGAVCDLYCPNGMVPPRNGCQPCICLPDYIPCMDDEQCGEGGVCDTSVCLSCCPGAPPGTACIDVCCGACS